VKNFTCQAALGVGFRSKYNNRRGEEGEGKSRKEKRVGGIKRIKKQGRTGKKAQ